MVDWLGAAASSAQLVVRWGSDECRFRLLSRFPQSVWLGLMSIRVLGIASLLMPFSQGTSAPAQLCG
jgi:hypothetical protein